MRLDAHIMQPMQKILLSGLACLYRVLQSVAGLNSSRAQVAETASGLSSNMILTLALCPPATDITSGVSSTSIIAPIAGGIAARKRGHKLIVQGKTETRL